jgi:AraC family transcriptional regulator
MSEDPVTLRLSSLSRYQEYVPGPILLKSEGDIWDAVQVRSHLFPPEQPTAPAPAIPQHTLTFVYSGHIRGARRTGGGPWTDFDTHPSGHVTIRPAGRSVALRWTADASVRTFSLYLTPERLEDVALQMGIAPSQVELPDHFHVHDPILESIAQRFREVVTGQRPEDPLYLQTIVQTLNVHLLREYTPASPSDDDEAGALSRPRLHRVQRYVWRHLDANLSLDDLADEVGISKYHFSRRFKKRTGQSPYQFVIYERVRAARQQLRETTQPLAQIALSTGFSSQSHFTRTFKQHMGVTPGQYRDAWR